METYVLLILIAAVVFGASFIQSVTGFAFGIGFIAMALGALIGTFARGKCNSAMIKKTVYGFMAISGIMNIITCLI